MEQIEDSLRTQHTISDSQYLCVGFVCRTHNQRLHCKHWSAQHTYVERFQIQIVLLFIKQRGADAGARYSAKRSSRSCAGEVA